MYTFDSMKSRLQDYAKIKRKLGELYEKLEYISSKTMGGGSRTISNMPHSPNINADVFMDAYIRQEAVRDKIRGLLNHQKAEKKAIESLLQGVPPREGNIIRMRYFDAHTWDTVCFSMFGYNENFSKKESAYLRQTYRLHNIAIKKMVDNCNRK